MSLTYKYPKESVKVEKNSQVATSAKGKDDTPQASKQTRMLHHLRNVGMHIKVGKDTTFIFQGCKFI